MTKDELSGKVSNIIRQSFKEIRVAEREGKTKHSTAKILGDLILKEINDENTED